MEIGNFSFETTLILGFFILFVVLIIYFYRFSNKKLMAKIKDLRQEDTALYKQIDKINKARTGENRKLKQRIELMEQKLDYIVKAAQPEKEELEEKVLVRKKR